MYFFRHRILKNLYPIIFSLCVVSVLLPIHILVFQYVDKLLLTTHVHEATHNVIIGMLGVCMGLLFIVILNSIFIRYNHTIYMLPTLHHILPEDTQPQSRSYTELTTEAYQKTTREHSRSSPVGTRKPINIPALLYGILYSFATILLVGILGYVVYPNLREHQILFFFARAPVGHLVAMLPPAIVEEVIFRGGMLHIFKIKHRLLLGVVISGFIFSAAHIVSVLGANLESITTTVWLCNLVLGGTLLGVLYLKYGLLVSIFFHWLWNASWYQIMIEVESSVISSVVIILVIIATLKTPPKIAGRQPRTMRPDPSRSMLQ